MKVWIKLTSWRFAQNRCRPGRSQSSPSSQLSAENLKLLVRRNGFKCIGWRWPGCNCKDKKSEKTESIFICIAFLSYPLPITLRWIMWKTWILCSLVNYSFLNLVHLLVPGDIFSSSNVDSPLQILKAKCSFALWVGIRAGKSKSLIRIKRLKGRKRRKRRIWFTISTSLVEMS